MKRIALVVSVITLVLAGCGTTGQHVPAGPSLPARPEPEGAMVVTPEPSSSGTSTPTCDPTASLRPSGPLPAPGAMPAGTTMARILARGRLVAGVDQNTFLFGFRNPFSGQLEGFDIDMVHQLSQAIFGDPNLIQFKVITSAERIPALQNGDVDVVVRTMTINCDRLQQVSFSTVYYQAGQRVLVDKDSDYTGIGDLGGKRVCAAKGSTSIQNLATASSRPTPVEVANWTDCLVMLQQRQVEGISTDDTILVGMAAQDPYTVIVGPRFTDEPYGLAMPKGQDDMVRFVNAVLDQMRVDGTWAAIHQKWLSRLGPAPTPPPARYLD